MKQITISLAVIALFAMGCKKESDDPIVTPTLTKNYLPSTPGSWWAYVYYLHDGNGNTSVFARDTLRVTGELTQNGNTYAQYEGSLWFWTNTAPPSFGIRDSSYCLVNERGNMILPYLNFTDTFNRVEEQEPFVHYQTLDETLVEAQVPAGTFQTLDFKRIVEFPDTTSCNTTYGVQHQQFAENVGLVRTTYWYASTFGCGQYTERQLEAYHLEVPLTTQGQ